MTTPSKSAAKAAAPRTLSAADLKTLRGHLRAFEFADVMNLLGWNRPKAQNVAPAQAAGLCAKTTKELKARLRSGWQRVRYISLPRRLMAATPI